MRKVIKKDKLKRVTANLSCLFLGVFSVIFTCVYGGGKIAGGKLNSAKTAQRQVVSVWHIDSFEGGVGSRKQFLLKKAAEFEKKENVLVMIVETTESGAEENFEKGIYPDAISYGGGINLKNLSELKVVGKGSVTGVNSGAVGEKTYACPWTRGGYALFVNPSVVRAETQEELKEYIKERTETDRNFYVAVGEKGDGLPLFSLFCEGFTSAAYKKFSPLEAYLNFVGGKTPVLLGTQRDVHRLSNRNFNAKTFPIEGFSDLFQYYSVFKNDAEKSACATRFLEYLISDTVQEKINAIGMFPIAGKTSYENEDLSLMQEIIPGKILSPFYSAENRKRLKKLAENYFSGDLSAREELIKIQSEI